MKKKIKLSIISTLLLTSTLAITLPIVSCSGSTNPTNPPINPPVDPPINQPLYAIDATRFDSNKLVKINEVVSSIVNDPNSTTQQKMTRYRNLNTYANNSELLKSVNDYFFLIDKNNNDKIIKDVIDSIEIIPTNNPTLTHGQAMPKVTIKINVKHEFIKDMEDTNFSSYSFDTGTLDNLGDINLYLRYNIDGLRRWIMGYVGTNPGSILTYSQQIEKIRSSGYTFGWSSDSLSKPSSELPNGRWDIMKIFFEVTTLSSPISIDINKVFLTTSLVHPQTTPKPGTTLSSYRLTFTTRRANLSANDNNFWIYYFNSNKVSKTQDFVWDETSSFGTLANS